MIDITDGPQVVSSLSDCSLVSICQQPYRHIQTAVCELCSLDTIHHDAARQELCRRYRPLIVHYTNRFGNRDHREDLENYLWTILLESIDSYDLQGPVPFPGFVKARVMYGYMRYWKKEGRTKRCEVHIPDREGHDGDTIIGLDQFPSSTNVAEEVMRKDEEWQLRKRLMEALGTLTEDQRHLLRRVYGGKQSFLSISKEQHCSRQAVKERHDRAIRRLRRYIEMASTTIANGVS